MPATTETDQMELDVADIPEPDLDLMQFMVEGDPDAGPHPESTAHFYFYRSGTGRGRWPRPGRPLAATPHPPAPDCFPGLRPRRPRAEAAGPSDEGGCEEHSCVTAQHSSR
jgi:hypothetical protein